ncbi:srpk [Culex quinquefasciatus]|uniref:non-specific serine/threonine protein kinase n=1 Tax=Culex quinquefasciatus TaxID=7176 RepID=B0WGI3_CULQU|nr:srpk [Culex quinquefasciatus]|eukprot:XP_001847817.1 srpk [Culex quinquefasciatus]
MVVEAGPQSGLQRTAGHFCRRWSIPVGGQTGVDNFGSNLVDPGPQSRLQLAERQLAILAVGSRSRSVDKREWTILVRIWSTQVRNPDCNWPNGSWPFWPKTDLAERQLPNLAVVGRSRSVDRREWTILGRPRSAIPTATGERQLAILALPNLALGGRSRSVDRREWTILGRIWSTQVRHPNSTGRTAAGHFGRKLLSTPVSGQLRLQMEGFEENFWKKAEAQLKCPVPAHLKRVLQRTGYLNCALEDLSEGQIRSIEEDIRSLPELTNLRPGNPKIAEFCGEYTEKCADFKLMEGERALLLKLSQVVKAKGWGFFLKGSKSKRPGPGATRGDSTDELALRLKLKDYFAARSKQKEATKQQAAAAAAAAAGGGGGQQSPDNKIVRYRRRRLERQHDNQKQYSSGISKNLSSTETIGCWTRMVRDIPSDDYKQEAWEDYCRGLAAGVNIRCSGANCCLQWWGHFLMVWLSWDLDERRYVRLKIVKSSQQLTNTAKDEIQIDAERRSEAKQDGALLNDFRITGIKGTHICLVFEELGHSLPKFFLKSNYRGIPLPNEKSTVRQEQPPNRVDPAAAGASSQLEFGPRLGNVTADYQRLLPNGDRRGRIRCTAQKPSSNPSALTSLDAYTSNNNDDVLGSEKTSSADSPKPVTTASAMRILHSQKPPSTSASPGEKCCPTLWNVRTLPCTRITYGMIASPARKAQPKQIVPTVKPTPVAGC